MAGGQSSRSGRAPARARVLQRLLLLAASCAAASATSHPGTYCTWAGFDLMPYVPRGDLTLLEQLTYTSCDDPKLDAEDRGHCKLCLKQTTRAGCLGTTGDHWNREGTDLESCEWVSTDSEGRKTREVKFTLGTNVPFMFAAKVVHTTSNLDEVCAVRREYTVDSAAMYYSAAYFVVYGDGHNADGTSLAAGLRPDASCVVRPPQKTCSLTLRNTQDIQFVISSRDIWTQNPTLIKQLNSSNNEENCIGKGTGTCVAAQPPFKYTVKFTEIPCAAGKGHSREVRCGGGMPMAQKGYLLYPAAIPTTYRHVAYLLDGLSSITWNVTSTAADLLVMVVPHESDHKVCSPWDKQKQAVCDFRTIRGDALPGTDCLGKRCSGKIKKKPDDDLLLLVTYPVFNREEKVIESQTIPTHAWVDLRGWP